MINEDNKHEWRFWITTFASLATLFICATMAVYLYNSDQPRDVRSDLRELRAEIIELKKHDLELKREMHAELIDLRLTVKQLQMERVD